MPKRGKNSKCCLQGQKRGEHRLRRGDEENTGPRNSLSKNQGICNGLLLQWIVAQLLLLVLRRGPLTRIPVHPKVEIRKKRKGERTKQTQLAAIEGHSHDSTPHPPQREPLSDPNFSGWRRQNSRTIRNVPLGHPGALLWAIARRGLVMTGFNLETWNRLWIHILRGNLSHTDTRLTMESIGPIKVGYSFFDSVCNGTCLVNSHTF